MSAFDTAAARLAALEAADPNAVRYSVLVDGNLWPAFGWRVGRFIVRRRSEREGSVGPSGKLHAGGWVLNYLPDGATVCDDGSISLVGAGAEEACWFCADEISRHVTVGASGFHAALASWPGIGHLKQQCQAIERGEAPVPWHHTAEYRRGVPTLRPCKAEEVAAAMRCIEEAA